MGVLLDKKINLCCSAIEAICKSPAVYDYAIGLTSKPLMKRRSQYQGEFHDCGDTLMIMLVDCLNRGHALDIEERLCNWARAAPKDSSVYTKFAPNEKGTRHWRNHGGTDAEKADQLIHGVYMAFWRPLE